MTAKTHKLTAADFICGSDEVGYGSWAGPLVVCAALVPRDWANATIVKDSKKFTTATGREMVDAILIDDPEVLFEARVYDAKHLDRYGVGKVLSAAHFEVTDALRKRCLASHLVEPFTVVDGNLKIQGATSLPKADRLVPAVSAASIHAKVLHDRIMLELDAEDPRYDLRNNMGYGTPKHIAALNQFGVSPHHRLSYSPMSELVRVKEPGQDFFDLMADMED